MDWIHDGGSDAFGYINYKSLESVLVSYPQCRYEVMLMAPQIANYYRIGNLISKHFFEKYSKKGYWVDIIMPSTKKYQRTLLDQYTYWYDSYTQCCTFSGKRRKDSIKAKNIPAHLHFFQRFVSLAETGGVFTDFTWMHHGIDPGIDSTSRAPISVPNPSSVEEDGGIILLYCGIKGQAESYIMCTDAYPNDICSSKPHCLSSSLLQFRPDSPIPVCMLELYHYVGESSRIETNHYNDSSGGGNGLLSSNESTFLACVYGDRRSGGVGCIRNALSACFSLYGIVNAFSRRDTHAQGSVMGFTIVADMKRAAAFWKPSLPPLASSRPGAVWLGPLSTDGQWSMPEEESPLSAQVQLTSSQLKSHVLRYVSRHPTNNSAGTRLHCSHYATTSPSTSYSKAQYRQAVSSCSPHFVIPGFMKAGTSFLYDALTRHPQIVHALKGVVFKETGCYLPNSMVPKKAPNRMTCFPFIEEQEGLIVGDGTVYNAAGKDTPHHFAADNRGIKVIFLVRSPIVRAKSHHRFNYKAFKSFGLQNMNLMVDEALDPGRGGMLDLHQAAVTALKAKAGSPERQALVEKLVDMYHAGVTRECSSGVASGVAGSGSGCNKQRYHRAANVIFHSLYFPAIWHWMRVVGQTNVLVLQAESIDTRLQGHEAVLAVLDKVHAFLGASPWRSTAPLNVDYHATLTSIPQWDHLNASSQARLEVFFRPFNLLLMGLCDDCPDY